MTVYKPDATITSAQIVDQTIQAGDIAPGVISNVVFIANGTFESDTPSSACSGWTNTGSNQTCTNTAGEVLAGTKAMKITCNGSSVDESAAMTLDPFMTGKTIYLTMQTRGLSTGTPYVAGNASVVILEDGVEQAYTLTSIPAGDKQLAVPFIPSSGKAYKVRFKTASASPQAITVDAIGIALNSPNYGTAVTDWVSFTPTSSSGMGTITNTQGYWRRCGENIELQVRFTTGTMSGGEARLDLPNSLVISSKLNALTMCGNFFRNNSTLNDHKQGALLAQSGATYLRFGKDEFAVAISPFSATVGSSLFGTGEVIVVTASVPIEGWSSNIVTADRALEEFVYNTSTSTTASDTTSFGYGVGGAQIQNITAYLGRTVRFQTPIQPTDRIVVEVSKDRISWHDASHYQLDGTNGLIPWCFQGSTIYGIGRVQYVNSTDIVVQFGAYADLTYGGTFGQAGVAWSSAFGAWYWRVRKTSGGVQVGSTAISARNILGGNTTPPTGYIGEPKTWTNSQLITSVAGTKYTSGTVTVFNEGTWLVTPQFPFQPTGSDGVVFQAQFYFELTSGTATVVGDVTKTCRGYGINGSMADQWSFVINVPAGQTATFQASAKAWEGNSGSAFNPKGWAIRVA